MHKLHTYDSIVILSYGFVLRCFGNISQSPKWYAFVDRFRHVFLSYFPIIGFGDAFWLPYH